jgi:hypothetical protein
MTRAQRAAEDERYRTWKGAYRPYDIIKEGTIAIAVIATLVVVLAVLFSSPDDRAVTTRSWSRTMPVNFLQTATSELDGTSETATYGPPYNNYGNDGSDDSTGSDGTDDYVQHLWFIHLQQWLGIAHPINAARDFVIDPLRTMPQQPALQAAITRYEDAPASQQQAWTAAYTKALNKASVSASGTVSLPAGSYGPVAEMMGELLTFARAGGLDGAILNSGQLYQTDYTKSLMFLADGNALAAKAQQEHLLGNQWGMMNETGSYPGQVWLWLYTFWYQISPFSTSTNADIDVMAIMSVLSLGLVLIPFIPGIRDIPRRIPLYRVIWRNHYRSLS